MNFLVLPGERAIRLTYHTSHYTSHESSRLDFPATVDSAVDHAALDDECTSDGPVPGRKPRSNHPRSATTNEHDFRGITRQTSTCERPPTRRIQLKIVRSRDRRPSEPLNPRGGFYTEGVHLFTWSAWVFSARSLSERSETKRRSRIPATGRVRRLCRECAGTPPKRATDDGPDNLSHREP